MANSNGDGFVDLAVVNNGSASVSVLLNAGGGPDMAGGSYLTISAALDRNTVALR